MSTSSLGSRGFEIFLRVHLQGKAPESIKIDMLEENFSQNKPIGDIDAIVENLNDNIIVANVCNTLPGFHEKLIRLLDCYYGQFHFLREFDPNNLTSFVYRGIDEKFRGTIKDLVVKLILSEGSLQIQTQVFDRTYAQNTANPENILECV